MDRASAAGSALVTKKQRWGRGAIAGLVTALAWSSGSAQASEVLSFERLQKQLDDSEARVQGLVRRVEQLEKQLSVTVPQAADEPVLPAGFAETRQGRGDATGGLDVDEQAAQRALERTLVRQGALLLPSGYGEFAPGLTYTRTTQRGPTFFTSGGSDFIGEREVRRDLLDVSVQMLAGLPWDTQLEVRVPYRVVDESAVTRVGLVPEDESSADGSGFGDVSVGFAKTLMRESGRWPDLVARLSWDTDTGNTERNGVSLGGYGGNEIDFGLNLLKREDPLVFTASVGYTATLEEADVDPGDEVHLGVGVFLAASPYTSLRFGLDQTFARKTKVDGQTLPGSDWSAGTFTFGGSSTVGRSNFVDFSIGVGLTDEAPDYSLGISYARRFDLFAGTKK